MLHFPLELEGKLLESTISPSLTTIDLAVTRRFYGFDAKSPGMEIVSEGANKTATSCDVSHSARAQRQERQDRLDPDGNSLRGVSEKDKDGQKVVSY